MSKKESNEAVKTDPMMFQGGLKETKVVTGRWENSGRAWLDKGGQSETTQKSSSLE